MESPPPPLTEHTIEELTDLFQAFQWLQKLKINSQGIKDLEDAKCRLLQYLKDNFGAGQTHHSSASSLVKEVLDRDKERRQQLTALYKEGALFLSKLPVPRRKELERIVPNFAETLNQNVANLQRDDCAILVAGEVSAGKSSLLNLILGEEMLSTSLLSCTSVICELKYGNTKYALAHPWEPSKAPERIELGEGDATTKLSSYVHMKGDRISRFPYKRVEIYWPFSLLKDGIVIVDSPGIGESKEMTRMVKEYIPSAFAFVYVINSGNAGGLQPDRLQDLLAELTRRNQEDEMRTFDPRSAIFVCNKWDQVPLDETKYVKKDTIDKLKKCWRGFDERQIFYLSATKATKSLTESGYVTQDFSRLLHGIDELFPISLRCKLEAHYRWLAHILRRSAFYLRAYIANETRTDEERKELTEYLHNQLDKLETESKRVTELLQCDVQEKTEKARRKLTKHLLDPSTKERLMYWEEQECPKGEDWDVVQEVLVSKVNKKIRREVNDWDNQGDIFCNIQEDMIQRFQDEFELMEDQLGVIEGNMVGKSEVHAVEKSAAIRRMKLEAAKPMLTTNQKIALGIAAPILIPLGVVVGLFALPVAGVNAIRNKLEEMRLLRNYKENKSETMSVMTKDILEKFTDEKLLSKLIREQLQAVSVNVESLIHAIPRLIEADRILIEKLQQERTASHSSLAEEYLPLYQIVSELQGRLDVFYAEKIRTYDYKFDDVVWDATKSPLASGIFGDIYAASLTKKDGNKVPCCVKVRKDTLSERNITDVIIEEENLKRCRHGNIAEYWGTCAKRKEPEGGLQYLVVLEPVCESLQTHIQERRANRPGKLGSGVVFYQGALRSTTHLARQIVMGLLQLHERQIVHRDLRPQNILLTDRDEIKLSDLGLTKPEGDISGAYMVSTCYSAPEVIEGREYNKAADIYSLAMVLWELWYGDLIQDEISEIMPGPYENAIRAGTRPRLTKPHEPPEDLKDIITRCWTHMARGRPTAFDVIEMFALSTQLQ